MPEPTNPDINNRPLSSVPHEVADKKSAASEMIIPGRGAVPDIRMHLNQIEGDQGPSEPIPTRIKKTLQGWARRLSDPPEKEIDKP